MLHNYYEANRPIRISPSISSFGIFESYTDSRRDIRTRVMVAEARLGGSAAVKIRGSVAKIRRGTDTHKSLYDAKTSATFMFPIKAENYRASSV